MRGDGEGSSSPPPSVLFRSPYIMDPLFVHYLPKPEQALWLGWESQTRLLELRLEKSCGLTGQILSPSLISWRPRGIVNYWLFLIPSQQWGWTGWGLRLLGDALSPAFPASFPRDPGCGLWGGGGFQIFLSQ